MKRSAYLAALGIILAGAPALAQELPKFDLQKTCGVASQNGTEGTARGCMASEQDARRELERRWTSFKPDSRSRCAQETQIGGSPSYVEVLTCVELAEGNLNPTPRAGAAAEEPVAGQRPAVRPAGR
jgi:hypothetical protein